MAISTTDYLCGDQFFRPNYIPTIGAGVPEHNHPFPHAVIAVAGWLLLRLYDESGKKIVQEWQIVAPEHRKLRQLVKLDRPIRFPDNSIHGIKPFEPLPASGVEIPFKPLTFAGGYVAEILPKRIHEVIALADNSAFTCTYSYRDPNTGGKVVEWNGNMLAVF